MRTDPLVSVITIFFNAETFIEEAIESVLTQTYINWELLLIDDGSSDRSTYIAKKYSQKYPDKIFYLDHPDHWNKGMSSSRNLGIKNSKGSLICFLDADDIWVPEKLSEQTKIMDENPDISMLYGSTLFWWSWLNKNRRKDYIRRPGVKPGSIMNPPYLIPLYLIVAAAVPATCSIMCRKKLFDKILFEESFTGLYEDQAFYYKVCFSEKVYVSGRIWDKYRQHENSACSVAEKNGELYTSRTNFLLWLWKYINRNHLTNDKVSLAIYQEFWKNRFLEKYRSNKFLKTLSWIIKWYFIFEMNFSERLRLSFWKRTKTFRFFSGINSQMTEPANPASIIWNNR